MGVSNLAYFPENKYLYLKKFNNKLNKPKKKKKLLQIKTPYNDINPI